jgi:hypothetical protein
MTVPLSEEVARSVPEESMARKDMGALCAWMTFDTVRERVEKIRTSPDWCVILDDDDAFVVCKWVEGLVGDEELDFSGPVVDGARGELGEGTGEG